MASICQVVFRSKIVHPNHRSGETQRLGSIAKEGSRLVRCLLAQVVVNVLRRDVRRVRKVGRLR